MSQLSLVVSHGGKAERLTDLSSNPKRHIEALRTFTVGHSLKGNKAGDFSFLNAIKVGKTYVPVKILVVFYYCGNFDHHFTVVLAPLAWESTQPLVMHVLLMLV